MTFRVNYETLAKMEDGHLGNIIQSSGHFFSDEKIENLNNILNKFLESKKQVGIIKEIKDLGGRCL